MLMVRPVGVTWTGSKYSATSTSSVFTEYDHSDPASVAPNSCHATGQVSVNTDPATVLVGRELPRGAQ
jgi:hypothetical protein